MSESTPAVGNTKIEPDDTVAVTTTDEEKPKTRPSVTDSVFLKIWQESDSVDDVCKKTGLTKTSAQAKAGRIRGAGVPLKEMKRGAAESNKNELLELLASLRSTDEAPVSIKELEAEAAEQKAKADATTAKRKATQAANEAAKLANKPTPPPVQAAT